MIYVDDLRAWPETAYTNARVRALGAVHKHLWCHLVTDGQDEELHKFAERIGMKRAWAQRGKHGVLHYDLVPPRRANAVRLGAKEITRKQLIEIVKRKQPAQRPGYVILKHTAPPWSGLRRDIGDRIYGLNPPEAEIEIDGEDAWYAFHDMPLREWDPDEGDRG